MSKVKAWVADIVANRKSPRDVAKEMRDHYDSDCSLRSKLSNVRSGVYDLLTGEQAAARGAVAVMRQRGGYDAPTSNQRRQEEQAAAAASRAYLEDLAALRALHQGLPTGPCKTKLAAFLEAPLRTQVVLHRRHRAKKLCYDVPAVDDAVNRLEPVLDALAELRGKNGNA